MTRLNFRFSAAGLNITVDIVGIDAVRQLLINSPIHWWGEAGGQMGVALDFAYVGIFAIVVSTIGILLSWRYLSK